LGHPVSDSWESYSFTPLENKHSDATRALGKVEQLRGVSYDLKDSGTRQIGVIAEEVGPVVPEVVTWESNGKDTQGVDYGRLTALLIEATKEQEKLIRQQQQQIRAQQAEIARLTLQVRTIQASLNTDARPRAAVRSVGQRSSQPSLDMIVFILNLRLQQGSEKTPCRIDG
jgi:hypothetical protein